jgi:hypothetical protein
VGWKRQEGGKKGEMICWYIPIRATGIYLNLDTEFVIEDDSDFRFNLPEIQIAGILLRYNDDIVSLGEMFLIESEKLSDQPLDSISSDRITCLLANSNPQSRDALPVLL